jgi:hypothetical protein
MNKKNYPEREDLTPEGQAMWDKMMGYTTDDYEQEHVVEVKTKTQRVIKEIIVETDESQRLRLDIKKLQQNSRIVIDECEKDLKRYTKKEEYFKANECKTAIHCHKNLVKRLQNILDGLPIFDEPVATNKIFIK